MIAINDAQKIAHAQNTEYSPNTEYAQKIAQIDEWNRAAWNIRQGALHDRLDCAERALALASSLEYRRGMGYAHRNRGALLKLLNRPDSALFDLRQALAIFKEIGDTDGQASAYTELGLTHMDLSAFHLALENLLLARQVFQELKDEFGVARTLTNIGNAYLRLEQFDEAAELYQQARSVHERLGKVKSAARAQANLGLTFLRRGEFERGLELVLQAIPSLQEQGLLLDVCSAYVTTGEIYLQLGHLGLAKQYFTEANDLAVSHDFKRGIVTLEYLRGVLASHEDAAHEATMLLEHAREMAREFAFRDLELKICAALSEHYEKQGDIQQALEHQKAFGKLKGDALRMQYRNIRDMREVTLRRELEEKERRWLETKNIELENANLELIELNEHKDEVLRIVSHDMRTPLGTIIGMGNLLRTEGAESMDEARSIGALIEESGQRLLNLVNGLLDVSHAESSAFQLDPKPTDLQELLRDSVRMFEPVAARKSVALDLENIPPLPEVVVDCAKIGQVMGNVLSNAVKFTPRGGRVSIRLAQPRERVIRIEVKDTGIGIPAEHIDHVFEKFGRHQRRGTEGERGTGLGMPIVKRFVELHGGEVSIQSTEESGTTVLIDLPTLA